MRTVIVFTLISNIAIACPNKVSPIKKGEVAKCDGFIFTNEAEKEAAEYRDDYKYYKSLYEKYKDRSIKQSESEQILEKRLKLYMDQSEKLAKYSTDSDLQKAIYFGLGFLVMYGAYQVAR